MAWTDKILPLGSALTYYQTMGKGPENGPLLRNPGISTIPSHREETGNKGPNWEPILRISVCSLCVPIEGCGALEVAVRGLQEIELIVQIAQKRYSPEN